jgi:hypothetical protein
MEPEHGARLAASLVQTRMSVAARKAHTDVPIRRETLLDLLELVVELERTERT